MRLIILGVLIVAAGFVWASRQAAKPVGTSELLARKAIEVSPELGRILKKDRYVLFVHEGFAGTNHIKLERKPVLVAVDSAEDLAEMETVGREFGRALESTRITRLLAEGEVMGEFEAKSDAVLLAKMGSASHRVMGRHPRALELIPLPFQMTTAGLLPDVNDSQRFRVSGLH